MASNSQSKRPSKDSKETSKKDASSGLAEQPPAIVDPDVILHQVPGVVYDHVIDHQILTETFKKEDVALKRLSDLQKSSVQANPQHLVYKPNPYNKSKHKKNLTKKSVKLCLRSSYAVQTLLRFDKFFLPKISTNFCVFRKSSICDWKSLNRGKSRRSRRSKQRVFTRHPKNPQ